MKVTDTDNTQAVDVTIEIIDFATVSGSFMTPVDKTFRLQTLDMSSSSSSSRSRLLSFLIIMLVERGVRFETCGGSVRSVQGLDFIKHFIRVES